MLDQMPNKTGNGNEVRARGAKIMVLFGTRPELIKLAPIIKELEKCPVDARVVSSSQHKDLLKPFLELLEVKVDFDLAVMKKNQTPNEVASKVLAKFDKLLDSEKPDLILVQGDTTTTLAGALAGFNRRIPVGHVEAGLRSGNLQSPFPEEMNRRVVSQIASYHFAATANNRANLLAEGIPSDRVFVTGNPVVDSLKAIMRTRPADRIAALIEKTKGTRRILLTTHRRESFGETMLGNLEVIRDFVKRHRDVSLIFPVHPNPNVKGVTSETLSGVDRVHLIDPVDYVDFIALMKASWMIVSDSGGVQEEAPTLGKPLLVLRDNTERPEAIHAGIAKLVGGSPGRLKRLLEENHAIDTWTRSVKEIANPFGDGNASKKIVKIIESKMAQTAR